MPSASASHPRRKFDEKAWQKAMALLQADVGPEAVAKGHFSIPRTPLAVPHTALYFSGDGFTAGAEYVRVLLSAEGEDARMVIVRSASAKEEPPAFQIASLPRGGFDTIWRTLQYLSRVRCRYGDEILSNAFIPEHAIAREWFQVESYDWDRMRALKMPREGYLNLDVYNACADALLRELTVSSEYQRTDDIDEGLALILGRMRLASKLRGEAGSDLFDDLLWLFDGDLGAIDAPSLYRGLDEIRAESRIREYPSSAAIGARLWTDVLSKPVNRRCDAALATMQDTAALPPRERHLLLGTCLRYLKAHCPAARPPVLDLFRRELDLLKASSQDYLSWSTVRLAEDYGKFLGEDPEPAQIAIADAEPRVVLGGHARLYDLTGAPASLAAMKEAALSDDAAIYEPAISLLATAAGCGAKDAAGISGFLRDLCRQTDNAKKREWTIDDLPQNGGAEDADFAFREFVADTVGIEEDDRFWGRLETVLAHVADFPTVRANPAFVDEAARLLGAPADLDEMAASFLGQYGDARALPALEAFLKEPGRAPKSVAEARRAIDAIGLRASSDSAVVLQGFDMRLYEDSAYFNVTDAFRRRYQPAELQALLANENARKCWFYAHHALALTRAAEQESEPGAAK